VSTCEAIPLPSLRFIGATKEVTGSCHLLEVDDRKVLLDFGMKQGEGADRAFEFREFHPGEIDAVLLSHAHIDHSGLLPYLVAQGFEGKIHSTVATKDLARLLLEDSAKIQKMDSEAGGEAPLYTAEDVVETVRRIEPAEYGKEFEIPGGSACFYDAGHILGSAVTVISAAGKTVCYTGDLGHSRSPILNAPQVPEEEIDYLIMESTYGNRSHSDERPEEKLSELAGSAYRGRGKLLVPVFAVGRAQELVLTIKNMKEHGTIPADMKVYLDSPMAREATELYADWANHLKPEFYSMFYRGESPFEFEGFELIKSHGSSEKLAEEEGPAIILAASGMLEGGRVLNHLPRVLKDRSSAICFVGYQAEGTLGRELVDGGSEVRVNEELVRVLCRVDSIGSYSAHAGRNGLLGFLDSLPVVPYKTFLVHGEPDAAKALAGEVHRRRLRVAVPDRGDREPFGGVVSRTVREKEFELGIKPSYTDIGGGVQVAPVVGALVTDPGGNVRLVSQAELHELMEKRKGELEGDIREMKAAPQRAAEGTAAGAGEAHERDRTASITLQGYREKLEHFATSRKDAMGDTILTRKLAHEIYCKARREGPDSVIKFINKKLEKKKFNVDDEEIMEEFSEFIKGAVGSLRVDEFCGELDEYRSLGGCE